MDSRTLTLTLRTDHAEIRVTLQSCGAPSGEKVTPAAAVAALTRRAETLLLREKGQPPPAAAELRGFGEELAGALLGPELLKALTNRRGGESLWILSDDPHLLNLPFELLARPGGAFLIEGGHLLLRRAADAGAPARQMAASDRPGPLRVLFMACSPQDGSRLAFEKEEEAMVKLCLQAGRGVHLEIVESGTFDELQDKVASYRPHIVQLSGHAGHNAKDDTGYFSFEDERGNEDPRSAREITSGIFENSGVAMIFLSGCGTAHSGIAGLCQAFAISGHVPLALGWGLPVLDGFATQFAESLLKDLAVGQSVNDALHHARSALLVDCRYQDQYGVERVHTDFLLPRLFAAGDTDTLFNGKLPPDPPPQPTFRYQQLGDNIEGLAEGFVGRRRLLQTTRAPLLDGDDGKRILLLTGIGGAGKSTFTTRLANYFEKEGWIKVALKPRADESAEGFAIRFLTQLHIALLRQTPPSPYGARLIDREQDLALRLEMAIAALNGNRILLILDNLESLMPEPPTPPEWRDGLFAQFFTELVNRLTEESRAILTCRYVPAGLEPAAARLVIHQAMPDFTEADFYKCLEYDEGVRVRLWKGEITRDLMAEFHRKLGATPGFLKQALPVLATLSAKKILDSLATIGAEATTNEAASSDSLRSLQQEYFAELFLPRLYEALSVPHRAALSRLAVSTLALPDDGVAAVTGLLPQPSAVVGEFLSACLRLGLVQRFADREASLPVLHAIYPLQRAFLTAEERLPEAPAAHHLLAEWLRASSLAEREQDLGLNPMALWEHCLTHAREAADCDLAAWAAERMGRVFYRQSEFRAMLNMAEPLLAERWHSAFLKLNADAMISLGDWPEARKRLEEAAPASPALDDRAGEAATCHNLASIDLDEGNHAAARERCVKALAIQQKNGNRAGEGVTWEQLAMLSIRSRGLSIVCLRLAVLALAILKSINDADQKVAFVNVVGMASGLGISPEALGEEIAQILASYQADRGAALLAAAFPEGEGV